MRSLKRTSYFVFTGVAVLLLFVIILGFRQYQLTGRYKIIITQSEQIIFQFSTIREQITTSLIENDWKKIVQAADQLKSLNSSLARLQENTLIPGEYRLDMAKQIDLSGMAISVKNISSASDKVAQSLSLQNKMRTLAEYLIQFDRIIVSHMRSRVVQFQAVMIGALGAVICLISFSLILIYKKTMLPILRLTKQVEDSTLLVNGFAKDPDACSEIAFFSDSLNELLIANTDKLEIVKHETVENKFLSKLINESTNLSNGIINYAQLLLDTYKEAGIGGEETKILHDIIDAAERIALLNKEI